MHQPESVTVNKTYLVGKDRASVCPPYPNNIQVKEVPYSHSDYDLFVRISGDENIGPSAEDRKFLSIMELEFCRHSSGHWIACLPFKSPRQKLPDNRRQTLHRAKILDNSFWKDSVKKPHFVHFMKEI